MTEHEIMDVMQATNSNNITATGVYFSILTAYLLVAYVAGPKLTKYQVAFVSLIFIFYNVVAAANIATMIRTQLRPSQQLIELSGERKIFSEGAGIAIVSLFISMRLMLVLGALIFMWQVRHPKTD